AGGPLLAVHAGPRIPDLLALTLREVGSRSPCRPSLGSRWTALGLQAQSSHPFASLICRTARPERQKARGRKAVRRFAGQHSAAAAAEALGSLRIAKQARAISHSAAIQPVHNGGSTARLTGKSRIGR